MILLEEIMSKSKQRLLLVFITIYLHLTCSLSFGQNVEWIPTKNPPKDFPAKFVATSQGEVFTAIFNGNGILKFDDETREWIHRDGGLPSLYLNELVLNSNDVLFTTDGWTLGRSFDIGVTWEVFDNLPFYIYELYVHFDDVLYGGGTGAVYQSNSNGESWVRLPSNGLPDTSPVDEIRLDSLGNIFVKCADVLWVSTDGGTAFSVILNEGISDILIDNEDTIFVGLSFSVGSIYTSTDHGAHFNSMDVLPQTDYMIRELSKDSAGNLYAGDDDRRIWLLENDGESFQCINEGWGFSEIYAILPRAENEIFVGTQLAGAFHTTNLGQNWSQINDGFRTSPTYRIFFVNDNLYAGVQYQGLYRSTDFGNEWTHSDIDGATDFILLERNGHLFVSAPGDFSGNSYNYRSDNFGYTWTQLGSPTFGTIGDLKFNSEGHLFATVMWDANYRSFDLGETWELWSDTPSGHASSILITPDDNIYLGYRNGIVYRSTDNGISWDTLQTPSDALNVFILESNQNECILAGSYWGWGSPVFRSEDFGQTWDNIEVESNGIQYALTSVNFDEIGQLFITSEVNGVFASQDNGENWSALNNGLPEVEISDLAIKDINDVYVSTKFGSIYHGVWGDPTNIHNFPEVDFRLNTSLEQNYPNPFNPSTTIAFSIPVAGKVKLDVFNVAGQLVKTLVNEKLEANFHAIFWDGTNNSDQSAPSGLYFYRLKTDSFAQTKRMILLK